MAKVVGRPGATLRWWQLGMVRKIVLSSALVAFFAYSVTDPAESGRPRPWIAIAVVGALVVARRFAHSGFRSKWKAIARGHRGEKATGRALEKLGYGWRVFNDVNLGGENADHVVVGPRGVFSIEVKNWSAPVVATRTGLFKNGYRQDDAVRQAWRVSHKLEKRLNLDVVPVLVVVGEREGSQAGRLAVRGTDDVAQYLRTFPWSLGYDDLRGITTSLRRLKRSRTRRDVTGRSPRLGK